MKKYLIFFIALSFFSSSAQTPDTVKQENSKRNHHQSHNKKENRGKRSRFHGHKHTKGRITNELKSIHIRRKTEKEVTKNSIP